MTIEKKLVDLGLSLPDPPAPVATYVAVTAAGDLLFVSGVIPSCKGKVLYQGKLGRDLSVQDGYDAAKITVLNALSIASPDSSLFHI